jgi:glycosyltransferase involved in cell wall biosynthesis
MNSSPPLVTTIIPVYNAERFLDEALRSVLSQDYGTLEIIVVDDGSTDGTSVVASQYKRLVRYVHQKNSGPAAARNHGISVAKGNLIAFLDADDLWPSGKLTGQVRCLLRQRNVEVVQGLIQKMQWETIGGGNEGHFKKVGEPYYFVNLGSALYRASVFEKVGLLDTELWENEDTDWFFRAWELGVSKVVLPEISLYYRIHGTNLTLFQNLTYHGIPRLFKQHLNRIRSGQTPINKPRGSMTDLCTYLGWNQNDARILRREQG